MRLAIGTPDLMQRLSRLPAAPNVTLLDRRKPKPHPWSHANTTFAEQIYIRWCCIDLSNAPRCSGVSVLVCAHLVRGGFTHLPRMPFRDHCARTFNRRKIPDQGKRHCVQASRWVAITLLI